MEDLVTPIGRATNDPRSGNRTTVVLLHAFPVDARVWRRQATALGEDFDVITPDFRGFGANAGGAPVGPFTLADLAADVKRLVDELNVGRVVLAGLSMGGYVAAAFAAVYPKMLKGLVLVDSKTEPDSPEAKAGRAEMIALAKEKGASAVADKMIPKMFAPGASAALVAELRAMIEACPVSTITTALAAMRDRPDRTAAVAESGVPVLVVVGQHDATISPAAARAMAGKIPGAKVVEVDGAGHLSPMEEPEKVTSAIRKFASALK